MINSVCGIGSTGRICTDIATALKNDGHDVKIAYGRSGVVPPQYKEYAIRIGNDFSVKCHALKARMFDASGMGSQRATKNFLRWVDEFNPDVIHLHNVHGYYIDIRLLFNYLKQCNKKIIWTLHDYWVFTGHSAYCDDIGCKKWVNGCFDCPQIDQYPKAIIDRSRVNWRIKKDLFSEIPNLTIVTPSNWLAELTSKSFLTEYPIKVIHNGIDTDVFKHIDNNFKKEHGIDDKKMVLGVASVWDRRKGLKYFIELDELLNDDYKIVLVGVKKEQIKEIPSSILCIERTNSVRELAELYSAADVFVNPTLEDNYPTTNLEAISCGTPVVTFDTGGSGESAILYGTVVPKGDLNALKNKISVIENYRRNQGSIDYKDTVQAYMKLYLN